MDKVDAIRGMKEILVDSNNADSFINSLIEILEIFTDFDTSKKEYVHEGLENVPGSKRERFRQDIVHSSAINEYDQITGHIEKIQKSLDTIGTQQKPQLSDLIYKAAKSENKNLSLYEFEQYLKIVDLVLKSKPKLQIIRPKDDINNLIRESMQLWKFSFDNPITNYNDHKFWKIMQIGFEFTMIEFPTNPQKTYKSVKDKVFLD
jgi:hypothetical protein